MTEACAGMAGKLNRLIGNAAAWGLVLPCLDADAIIRSHNARLRVDLSAGSPTCNERFTELESGAYTRFIALWILGVGIED